VSIRRNSARLTHVANSQIETLTFYAHAYEISDAVAFLLRKQNPNWPDKKTGESRDELLSS